MTNKKYVLFDLDGTLTDPKEGICTCVQYALKEFGIWEKDLDKLEPFIGPPLKDSFMEFYGFGEEQAKQACDKYRERFRKTGKFENKVYPGIPELLQNLNTYGYHLAVASSKPEEFVKEILAHFEIAEYFEVVVGSEMDGTRTDKAEVIQEALNRLFHYKAFRRDQIVMVGDRKFDVKGAKDMGVTSVAVAYGYGTMEELKQAQPDYIAGSVEELGHILMEEEKLKELKDNIEEERQKHKVQTEEAEKKPKKGTMQLVWGFLFPMLLFYFAGEFLRQAVGYLMMFLAEHNEAIFRFMFVAEDSDAERWAVSGNGNAIIQILALIGVFFVLYKLGGGKNCLEEERALKKHFKPLDTVKWTGMAVVLGLGLNFLFVALGLLEASESYQEVASSLYSVSIPAGVLLYGIYSPLTEEFLFRGIIFHKVKEFMKPAMVVLLSSALFGVYHGNSIQLVYGFAMGYVLGWAYHYSGSMAVTVIMHGVLNVIIFLTSCLGFMGQGEFQLQLGIVLTLTGVVLFRLLRKPFYLEERKKDSR